MAQGFSRSWRADLTASAKATAVRRRPGVSESAFSLSYVRPAIDANVFDESGHPWIHRDGLVRIRLSVSSVASQGLARSRRLSSASSHVPSPITVRLKPDTTENGPAEAGHYRERSG